MRDADLEFRAGYDRAGSYSRGIAALASASSRPSGCRITARALRCGGVLGLPTSSFRDGDEPQYISTELSWGGICFDALLAADSNRNFRKADR